jgi:hypothetical protein
MAAVIPSGNPTILDQVKRTDPDGSIARIVEALTERNPILMDATAMEGNLPTGHRVTIRSGLPSVGWRLLNAGIDASKSTTIQVDEACGLLEARSEVDCELARLNGNEAAFRASEDMAFIQAMNNEAANAIFYASTATDPEKIHGLTPRFDALTANDNSDNVIDAGLSPDGSDHASMWFVTWHPDTCYLIYPKGTQGGLTSEDLGKEYVEDAASKKFLAWRTHFIWRLGLCVKDWRYIVRVCNIDTGKITATGRELLTAMIEAYNHIFDLNTGRTVIYCNRTVLTWLDKQIMLSTTSNLHLSHAEWHGRKVVSFRGIPIVPVDALSITEAEVT